MTNCPLTPSPSERPALSGVLITVRAMCRCRLYPTPEQETLLRGHARFMWNLAVEQLSWSRPGRWVPSFAEQCRQLTDLRGDYEWLRQGSQTVQQQALRDFAQAMTTGAVGLIGARSGVGGACTRGSGS
jgi:putative transposase